MDQSKTVAVNIVAWNSLRYLPELLESVDEQDEDLASVTVVDNASADGTLAWLSDHRPDVALLRNFKNQGFARGHNQAISLALARFEGAPLEDRFVLVTNPDLVFAPSCLRELVTAMREHPDAAMAYPKLLRAMAVGEREDGRPDVERTDVIDSTGISIGHTRRSFDRGAGETDKGQYDNVPAFGGSGACLLIRASALATLKEGDGWFDEDFFAYKEDVDLAWRARRLGLETLFVPQAVAWHHRRAPSGRQGFLWLGALSSRNRKPYFVNRLSMRNHWWLLIKHEEFGNAVMHALWIVPYEAGKTLIALVTPTGWAAIGETLAGWPKMWQKRWALAKRAKVKGAAIRKLFA